MSEGVWPVKDKTGKELGIITNIGKTQTHYLADSLSMKTDAELEKLVKEYETKGDDRAAEFIQVILNHRKYKVGYGSRKEIDPEKLNESPMLYFNTDTRKGKILPDDPLFALPPSMERMFDEVNAKRNPNYEKDNKWWLDKTVKGTWEYNPHTKRYDVTGDVYIPWKVSIQGLGMFTGRYGEISGDFDMRYSRKPGIIYFPTHIRGNFYYHKDTKFIYPNGSSEPIQNFLPEIEKRVDGEIKEV